MKYLEGNRTERIESLQYKYKEKEKEDISKCNLCEKTSFIKIEHEDRYGYPASASTCAHCGLTMINPRMTSMEYTAFYKDVYRPLVSAYHGRLINAQTIQAEQKEYALKVVEYLSAHMGKKQLEKFLDVGGSTGIVSKELVKHFNFNATIIDPAPAEIEEAKALGIESITGFVEDWDPGNRTFDVIGLFQTIDHLLDIKETLKKIRALISDEGIFLVDIVDFRFAYLRHWDIKEAIKIDHPYYLTDFTAESYLCNSGFKIVEKIISPDKLHIMYVCTPHVDSLQDFPDSSLVQRHLEEIRYVQGTQWKKNK